MLMRVKNYECVYMYVYVKIEQRKLGMLSFFSACLLPQMLAHIDFLCIVSCSTCVHTKRYIYLAFVYHPILFNS